MMMSTLVAAFQNTIGRISSKSSQTTATATGASIVLAMQNSSSTTMPTHRILCYGDSLTAGTSGMNLYPYAPYLERAFNDRTDRTHEIMVRYRGLPGWTAAAMVEQVDGPSTGLRPLITNAQPVSVVIILAGTNDMAYGQNAKTITEDVLLLHKIAWEQNVPRTIAITIPPSGYQSANEQARSLADEVNRNLEEACSRENSQAIFMQFPFEYERGGENWHPDSLHLSERGYKVLAESLIETVESALTSIEQEVRKV
jgi:lysophospholipase L1-like esterase